MNAIRRRLRITFHVSNDDDDDLCMCVCLCAHARSFARSRLFCARVRNRLSSISCDDDVVIKNVVWLILASLHVRYGMILEFHCHTTRNFSSLSPQLIDWFISGYDLNELNGFCTLTTIAISLFRPRSFPFVNLQTRQLIQMEC